jgi:hypothetical protein
VGPGVDLDVHQWVSMMSPPATMSAAPTIWMRKPMSSGVIGVLGEAADQAADPLQGIRKFQVLGPAIGVDGAACVVQDED